MKPSKQAYEIIKMWEQLRLRAYKAIPTEKNFTIGWGHCSPEVTKNQLITRNQADELLFADVLKFSNQLSAYCPKLKQCEFDALVSFIYNVGWYAFRYSMTGILASECNISIEPLQVAKRFLLWVRSSGVVITGLQKRRVYEANYFLGYKRFTIIDGDIFDLVSLNS